MSGCWHKVNLVLRGGPARAGRDAIHPSSTVCSRRSSKNGEPRYKVFIPCIPPLALWNASSIRRREYLLPYHSTSSLHLITSYEIHQLRAPSPFEPAVTTLDVNVGLGLYGAG